MMIGMDIHRALPLVLIGAAMLPGALRAESYVTVYGLADVSVKIVSNYAGGRRVGQDSGDQQSPRLGFKGSEDLGRGVRAVFVAETGFNMDTGGFAQGGTPFARQDYLGIGSPVGTLTAGRQYDFMADLGAYHAVWQGTGTLDWNLGDNDRLSGQRLDNSVKYLFQKEGWTAGALYSFSETSATTRTPHASSFLGSYTAGGWSLGAAATLMRNASVVPFSSLGVSGFFGVPTVSTQGAPLPSTADRIDNFGVGSTYTAGSWSIMGLLTETHYARGAARERIRNGNLGVRYGASNGLVYTLSLANSALESSSAKRVALAADWLLSKRTDLYLYAVAERARGQGARAVLFTTLPSSGPDQHAVALGMRHKF